MKFSKHYLLLTSLLSSVIGLIMIYIAAINIEPREIAISDITADMEGRKIITAGYLVEKKKHQDGHIFLTISDNNSEVQVPLFSNFIRQLNQAGINESDFQIKNKIVVEGLVENYKGRLQIMPRSLDGIKIMGE